MLQRLTRVGLLTASLVMGLTLTAQATLIGDSVNMHFVIANQSFNETATTTVTADASDEVTLMDPRLSFLVDPFDSGFVITFQNQAGFPIAIRSGSFLEFSDLQWQGIPGQVTGITLTQNWTRFENVATSFTNNSASIIFENIAADTAVSPGQQLTVTLQTDHAPVPEPSTLLLLGSGLAGLIAWRRRTKKH